MTYLFFIIIFSSSQIFLFTLRWAPGWVSSPPAFCPPALRIHIILRRSASYTSGTRHELTVCTVYVVLVLVVLSPREYYCKCSVEACYLLAWVWHVWQIFKMFDDRRFDTREGGSTTVQIRMLTFFSLEFFCWIHRSPTWINLCLDDKNWVFCGFLKKSSRQEQLIKILLNSEVLDSKKEIRMNGHLLIRKHNLMQQYLWLDWDLGDLLPVLEHGTFHWHAQTT